MRISEKCACGATVDVEGPDREAQLASRDWREQHRHAEPPTPEDGPSGTESTFERADPHTGPSMGFRVPDAEPETWEMKR